METLKRYINPNAIVAVVIFVAITVTQTSFLNTTSNPPQSTKHRKKSASYGQKPISDSKFAQLTAVENNKPIRRDVDGQIRDNPNY